jgi:Flp pilus assembly protein TadD
MRKEELVLQESAEAAERSGDLAAAFDVWQTLSSIDVDRPDYFCKLGCVARKLGRWACAEQAFLDAIRLDIKKADKASGLHSFAVAMLGSLFLARADGDRWTNALKAKAWLEQAFALSPTPMSLTFLGAAHIRLREREAAKEAFRKAIQLDESYEEAYFNLGLL